MACRKQMSRPQQAIMYASIYHSMDDKKAPSRRYHVPKRCFIASSRNNSQSQFPAHDDVCVPSDLLFVSLVSCRHRSSFTWPHTAVGTTLPPRGVMQVREKFATRMCAPLGW